MEPATSPSSARRVLLLLVETQVLQVVDIALDAEQVHAANDPALQGRRLVKPEIHAGLADQQVQYLLKGALGRGGLRIHRGPVLAPLKYSVFG